MRDTIQGQANQLPHPVYLPPIHLENTRTVGGDEDVTLTIEGFQGFKMIVKAGSVTFPDGSTEGELVASPVHNDRLPMVPPGTAGRFLGTGWTLQPAGTRFDPPIEIHIPNVNGLSPGTTMPIVQWDHDMAYFVPMGQGTISEDGSTLVSNTDSGITKAGWGGGVAPPPPADEAECENGTRQANGQCSCEVIIKADGEEDELWTPFDKDGTEISFVAEIGSSCGNATALWTFEAGLMVPAGLTTTHEFSFYGNFPVTVEVFCPACNNTTDTIEINIFKIRIDAPVVINQVEDEVETEFLANWTGGAAVATRDIEASLTSSSSFVTFEWSITPTPTAAGIAATANPDNGTGEDFTFEPRVEHPAYNNNGTQGSRNASDPIEYEIEVNSGNDDATLKIIQDEISIIRQEYVNHNPPRGIPPRSDFTTVVTTSTIAEPNRTPYIQTLGTPIALAESVRTAFNLGIANEFTPPLTPPPNYNLTISSGWRNPERNELVGGHLNSRHQYGNAIDLIIVNIANVSNLTGLATIRLWQILEAAGDSVASGICEINSAQDDPCTSPLITHVHVQQ